MPAPMADIKRLWQLRNHTLDDIKGFLVDYNCPHDKKFQICAVHGPKRAALPVKKGAAAYRK